MRAEFVNALNPLIKNDEKAVFLTGDLGYRALEETASMLGPRFINAGVAEQNMMGMAAGMALAHFRPWVYSIIPFVTFRCFEQIRNDVCFHNLPVRIVGNGGGYTYGVMGSTHHALEDLGVLKMLPNMYLYFPCAPEQVEAVVQEIHQRIGPSYLRLAVSPYLTPTPVIHEQPITLTRQYSKGSALTIVGIGHAVQIALSALKNLNLQTYDVSIFGVAKFPFDRDLDEELFSSIQHSRKLIIIDEHYSVSSLAETFRMLCPQILDFKLLSARYFKEQKYGSHKFHLQQSGLSPEDLVTAVKNMCST